MESIYAIAFGLGLRAVLTFATHRDFKIEGPLVGLWEGVVTLHFMKKMPSSFDPYIAWGVRMFIDFLVTESVSRMVLVIIWSGLGMVLADVAPSIWFDVGLHRPWRRIRRDLYTLYSMTPNMPQIIPRARVVRFSRSGSSIDIIPSLTQSRSRSRSSRLSYPEIERDEPRSTISDANPPESVIEERTEPTSVTRRRVATPSQYTTGYTTVSDVESVARVSRTPSAASASIPASATSTPLVPTVRTRRATVYHHEPVSGTEGSRTGVLSASASVTEDEEEEGDDLDVDNLSSIFSSKPSTQGTPEQRDWDLESSIESAPEIDAEEEVAIAQQHDLAASAAVAAAARAAKKDEEEPTPRARPMYLPPTPSDSAAKWELSYVKDDVVLPPPAATLQQIPDDDAEDWDRATTVSKSSSKAGDKDREKERERRRAERRAEREKERQRIKQKAKEKAKEQEENDDIPPPTPAKDDLPPKYRKSSSTLSRNTQTQTLTQHTPMSTNSLGLETAPEELPLGVSTAAAAATAVGGLDSDWKLETPVSQDNIRHDQYNDPHRDDATNTLFGGDDDDMYLDEETSRIRREEYFREAGSAVGGYEQRDSRDFNAFLQEQEEEEERRKFEKEKEDERRKKEERREKRRLKKEAEAKKAKEEEEAKAAAEAEAARQVEEARLAKEAEVARLAAEEAEKKRVQAEEEERRRLAQEAAEKRRQEEEAEAEKNRLEAEEAEKARVAAEEAERERRKPKGNV
ncbi:hypothetical protein H1R20_g14614, partial [Candolleomyces eurysporus]